MSEITTQHVETQPCLAVPSAARHGWREDALCASMAKTEVEFCGRQVPVCRMHEATYERWGDAAEQNAVELWRWVCGDAGS